MSDQLSDGRLLKLLNERPGRELTDAELKQVSGRVNDSVPVQDALLARAEVDERLAKQLATVRIPLHVYLARQQSTATAHPRNVQARIASLASVCFLVGMGSAYLLMTGSDTPAPLVQVGNPEAIARDALGGVLGKTSDESQTVATVAPVGEPRSKEPANAKTPGIQEPEPKLVAVPEIPAIVQHASKPPWTATLDETLKPRLFEEVGFAAQNFDGLDPNAVREWLAPMPGWAYRVEPRNHGKTVFSRFTGVAQLRAPWPKDAVLRLGMYQPSDFRIHFWSGRTGATLHYMPTLQTWMAYRIHRLDDEAVPTRWSMASSDEARHQRTTLGVIEIRHQGRHLLVTRGDVVLLATPLADVPTQVVFDGSTYLSEFRMYRSTPAPYEARVAENRIARNENRPADLEWVTAQIDPMAKPQKVTAEIVRAARKIDPVKTDPDVPADEAKEKKPQPDLPPEWKVAFGETNELIGHPSGAIELATEIAPQEIRVATFINADRSPQSSLSELCFRIDRADAGTGFFLGDEFGQPIERIAFYDEQTTGLTIVGHLPLNAATTAVTYNPTTYRITAVESGTWIRVSIGLGGLKLWMSGDGMHWSRVLASPIRDVFLRPTTIGLYALPGTKRRKLKLDQFQVRDLAGITELARRETRELVPPMVFGEQSDLGDWLHQTVQSQPPHVSLEEWTRACAIRALESHAPRQLCVTLAEHLLAESIKLPLDAEQIRRTIDDFAVFSDGWDQLGTVFVENYRTLGERLERDAQSDAFDFTTRAMITAPIWTTVKLPIIEQPRLHRTLLASVYREDWPQAARTTERVRFWRRSSHPDQNWSTIPAHQRQSVEWTEAIARLNRQRNAEPGKEAPNAQPIMDRWQQPLVWDMSKEAYNLISEFESALQSEAWKDACQIIATASEQGAEFMADEDVLLGLLPDWKESSLLISLPVAIELAVKDYRGLRDVMRDELGPRGMLRVRQLIELGDADAVRTSTLQYYGTQAAAVGHEWLGDRALSLGQFDVAAREFQRALPESSPAVRQALQHRMRLSRALAGRRDATLGTEDSPLPAPQEAVAIGATSLTGRDFMSLVSEITNTRTDLGLNATDTSRPGTTLAPRLASYKVELTDTFAGNMGKSPGQSGYQATDWAARQMSVVADHELLFVSNRFQVVAFGLNDGKKRQAWTMAQPGTAHDWTLLPMSPLIAGNRIYVRWLTAAGPELVCLDRNSNKVIWSKKADGYVASDPVLLGGRLMTLVAKSLGNSVVRFDLATFDPATGDIINVRPFMRQHDKWSMKPSIRVHVHNGSLICGFDSMLVALDEDGSPRWLNQQTWLPKEMDPAWLHRDHSPIMAQGDSLFVVQLGARTLSSVDATTGRTRWTQPLFDVRRLIGLADQRIIVETDAGFAAFATKDGKRIWTVDVPEAERLHAAACGGEGGFVYARHVLNGSKGSTASLVWVDIATGRAKSVLPLTELANPKHSLFVGPLAVTNKTIWTFFGTEWNKPERQLVRLTRTTSNGVIPVALDATNATIESWTESATASRISTTRVLGDWTLATRQTVSGQFDGAEILGDFRGEKDVLQTRVLQGHPVRFMRRIDVPKAGNAALDVRVGHAAGQRWTLAIHAAGEELGVTTIDDTSAPSGWRQQRFDLSKFAGTSLWLSVTQQPAEAGNTTPTDAYWKMLKVTGVK
ncbi:MAG: PQQ-like beta-propeller repeat protein [Planctomycetota bacterium]|nr:PQQ-like beta-propeller repeat protein [Planctomycetota bacterium]